MAKPQKTPRHATSVHGPRRPTAAASPMGLKLDRSFAQKVRMDRGNTVNYETAAKRAAFWARQQIELAAYEAQIIDDSLIQISQGTLKENSQFPTANIRAATLRSAAPAFPGETTIAGIEAGGVAPPPPPAI